MQSPVLTKVNTSIGGVRRYCPVCASSNSTLIFTNRMVPCAGYDFSAPIVVCNACGVGYAGTALRARDLTDYYVNLSKYDTPVTAADISPLDRQRADLAAAFVGPLAASIDSALDVGCSAGVFLSKLRAAGIKHVRGIDPAAQAGEVARKLFEIEVRRAPAEGYDGYGQFDLVCMMAVLEHLLEPRGLLDEVARQLKPGARVLIEVPDAGAFDRPVTHESFEPLGEFSNEHINFFTIADIRRLANLVGLDVERWTSFRTTNGSPGLFAILRQGGPSVGLVEPTAGSTPSRAGCHDSLLSYVSASLRILDGVEARLMQCGKEVLIYGAGNHTARLLVQSPTMAQCAVRAVFDRNRHLQGLLMGAAPILSPSSIPKFSGLPIIVSTFNANREIQGILNEMTSQPVVALYG